MLIKLTGIYVNKRLASLLICTILLLSYLLPFTNVIAAYPGSGPGLAPDLQETTLLVIEGRVEQIISEMQSDGLITSRAIVTVEEVVQGTLQDSQITIRYLGGTVGKLTLRVSDEPHLVEGMPLRAKLTPNEGGDYHIASPDTDLTILEGGAGVAYVPTGQKWSDTSIPVPIGINANTDDIPGDGERTAVQNAMNTWTNASCSYFEYSYQVGSCTTGPLDDGVNCVSWTTQSGESALARSYWWYSGSTILETDIVLYDEHTWSTDGSAFDVESVVLHELGHSLGLDHTEYNNSAIVMYWAISSGQIRRSLHTDDLNGVCALYPGSPSPPSAPSGLTATPVSPNQTNLSWIDNSDNDSGFKIEQSPNGTDWAQIDTVGADATTYSDAGLTCSTLYYYRVRAYNASGDSDYSNIANATTLAKDEYEFDDTDTSAKSITVNGPMQHHNFHQNGDEDWVKFTATAGETYNITTSNLGGLNDTILRLYNDADFTNWIEQNDDCSPSNQDSCINNWTAPSNGTYYVKVFNHNDEGGCTGYEYDLAVRSVKRVYLSLILKNSQ